MRVQLSLMEADEEGETPSSPSILVEWLPGRVLEGGAKITGYTILVNGSPVSHLSSSGRPSSDAATIVYGKLDSTHLARLSLLPEERLVLSVRSVSEQYQSQDSAPIVLPRELFDQVMAGSNKSRECLDSSGGALVGSSSREGSGGHVTSADSHVTHNGPQVNGCVSGDEIDGNREMIKGGPRYYVATFSYNPTFHSPNEETADDELAFRDGDIITVSA